MEQLCLLIGVGEMVILYDYFPSMLQIVIWFLFLYKHSEGFRIFL